MRYKIALYVLAIQFIACSGSKEVVTDYQEIDLDTAYIVAAPPPKVFHGSKKKVWDLIHTKLELSFDWDSSKVIGKANIFLKPYLWPSNHIEFDARGFKVQELKVHFGKEEYLPKFKNTGSKIIFDLNRLYSSEEEIEVIIKYTSIPNNLEIESGIAIQADKGLYFIKEDDNPYNWQIWSQGETEANSAWFPTIEATNERMKHDILLTVDTIYETLSNGIKLFENSNGDGTKTVMWKMEQPHAPYLVMIAIGDFAVVEDKWKDIQVNYYVEHPYKEYADDIFGKTPEMIEFFSNKLQYPYPWAKYSQITVKEFVSGAMENTTAVVHGDFLQQTPREMLDRSFEDFVSHELFHHWFGDLVTCESWANIALNESFATYGEYLWIEHAYDLDQADNHLNDDLLAYLREASTNKKKIVRYDYQNNDDVFDSHSYQKGGRVLHMLRQHVGDEIFFLSLTKYLKKYEYQSVEMSDFRQVVEEVSGEDLTWFFDQWFYQRGHPVMEYSWEYNDQKKKLNMTISQKQNFSTVPLFILPIKVDIYLGDTIITQELTSNKDKEIFSIDCQKRPRLVNFDADKAMICEKTDHKTAAEWRYMYSHGKRWLDRYEASMEIIKIDDSSRVKSFELGLNDKHWSIRELYVNGITGLNNEEKTVFKEDLIRISQNDEKSYVRSAAIAMLADYYEDSNLEGIYTGALQDSSFEVVSTALRALYEVNKISGLEIAEKLENEENDGIIQTIADIYGEAGNANHNAFFEGSFKNIDGFEKFSFINAYASYVERQNDSIALRSMDLFVEFRKGEQAAWIRAVNAASVKKVEEKYKNRMEMAQVQLNTLKSTNPNYAVYVKMKSSAEIVMDKIEETIEVLLEGEDNDLVQRILKTEKIKTTLNKE